MNEHRRPLIAALFVGSILAFATPGYTQEVSPTAQTQPPTAQPQLAPTVAPAAPSEAPAMESTAPPAEKSAAPAKSGATKSKAKKKHTTHHKHKKKTSQKKTSHKTNVASHHKTKKKHEAHAQSHSTHTKKAHAAAKTEAPAKASNEEISQPLPLVEKRSASQDKPTVKHYAMEKEGNLKKVTYDFCVGYENCVPHRYEATLQSGKVGNAKVMKQVSEGNWAEEKIDPVVASDLDKMAVMESSGSSVSRTLTPMEKAKIADHQGKMHASLISDIKAGPARKEEAKALMRELHIHNVNDLEAYDPRLGRNEAAVSLANELANERTKTVSR